MKPTPDLTLDPSGSGSEATARQIRGSALLVVGRLIAIVLGLLAHVLIVRYLSKADYGAFAYGLSIVSVGSSIAVFGLNKTFGRFAPIYDESGDDDRLLGAILLVVGTVASIGLILIIAFYAFHGALTGTVIQDPMAVSLLLILILLIPLQALDSNFVALFAFFANPGAIFLRRHIVGPLLELGVIAVVITASWDVVSLAVGYVTAATIGIGLYVSLLVRVLRDKGYWARLRKARPRLPVREMFGFTIPLLSSDLVFQLRGAVVVILLEAFRATTEVAAFRAVLPLARQNSMVQQNFTFLFTPSAARLYARKDYDSLNDLYWRTAIWVTLLTFPIFLASFSMARPITVLLFGSDYAESGVVTAVLALGFYVHAAFGFNGLVLRVFGRVRYIVMVDIMTAVVGLAANVWLIASYGAIGAAVGTSGILIAQNVLYQAGLSRHTPVRLFDWRYLRVYVWIAAISGALFVVELFTDLPFAVVVGLAVVTSLALIRWNRHALDVRNTFPELLRIPVVNRLLS